MTARKPPTDVSLAALAGLAVLAVYVRTLLPDVGGYEDTPKFQYLGAMLGTAHRPGYPLYILLSHLFSYLPIGNVAYRADLFSAVAGAATVAHVFLLARALGCGRVPAWLGALALGFGSAFWNYAVLAEVYTLAALLLVATLYWMVRWGQSGRAGHLYVASACFALALGNHVSIAMAAPAIALFLIVSQRRRTLTVRQVVIAGLITASGLLQYTFVLIRTLQGAPWVEAHAATGSQLAALVNAQSYDEYILPFTWHNLVTEYLPRLSDWAGREFGFVGLALAALGLAWVVRHDWRSALLLGSAAVGTVALFLHLSGDLRGFLVPVWGIVAVFVAAGAEAGIRAARQTGGREIAAVTTLAILAYPAWPLTFNFEDNDWSWRTHEARFLREVVRSMPTPAALVREDYTFDAMISYLQTIERHPVWSAMTRPEATLESVQPYLEQDVPVFAFETGATSLMTAGLDLEPVTVPGTRLTDRIRELPAGSTVVIAASGTWLPVDALAALGIDAGTLGTTGRVQPYQVVVATIGETPQRVEDNAGAQAGTWARLSLDADVRRWVKASASPDVAYVGLDDQILEAVTTGLVVLLIDVRLNTVETFVPFGPDLVAPAIGSRRVYRVTGWIAGPSSTLAAGSNTWTDVTAAASDGWMHVTVDNFRAYDATTTAWAVADTPLSPDIDSRFGIGPRPALDVQVFDRSLEADRSAIETALADDGLAGRDLGPGRFVARLRQVVNDGGEMARWGLALGAVPSRVWLKGTTDLPNPQRVTAGPTRARPYLERHDLELVNASASYGWLFGLGWQQPVRDAGGEYRWTSDRRAHVLLPIAGGRDVTVGLTVLSRPTTADPEPVVSLELNGRDLGPCGYQPGWRLCTWRAPADVVRSGTNLIVVRSSSVSPADEGAGGDSRLVGVAVRQILLRR